MDVTVINPFLTACENAFKTMFNLTPEHKAPYLLDVLANRHWEISGLLGLTGDYTGVLAFRLHTVLAAKMLETSGMQSDSPEENKELTSQLVSEFTNIIGGNAASAVTHKNINITPPVVITGKDHIISWPRNYPVVAIPFVTQFGPFEVDVCLK
jgi:chemotaxis protein CheX